MDEPRGAPSRTLVDSPFEGPPGAVAVPVSSLYGAGGVLIGMVIAAFFVGRCSIGHPPPIAAVPALAVVPAAARPVAAVAPRGCWTVKQPAMLAPRASNTIPFEVTTTRTGSLAIGYAQSDKDAAGLELSPVSWVATEKFSRRESSKIDRVVPTPAVEFKVSLVDGGGALKSPIEVPAAEPFTIGVHGAGVAIASPPGGPPQAVWPLSGDEEIGAANVLIAGDRGYALTFRRDKAIWAGWLGPDRKPVGEIVKVMGSGGAVGKPLGGWNGKEVAVIFADQPEGDGSYQIRIGHGLPGAVPTTTSVLPLPKGGPGGSATAPDIAGLADGRWLLVWTEGSRGKRAVRAQTLTADFKALGDPIPLSPATGNYGQGVIGITAGYAAIVFLSNPSRTYELWGTVLQCG